MNNKNEKIVWREIKRTIGRIVWVEMKNCGLKTDVIL
jgi:hypothetical protein